MLITISYTNFKENRMFIHPPGNASNPTSLLQTKSWQSI